MYTKTWAQGALEGKTRTHAEIRRSDLSVEKREDYIKVVRCLQNKTPKATQYPGVEDRFDDFVASTIIQAMVLTKQEVSRVKTCGHD